MSEYTEKLQEWVDSVKMCEAAGMVPCYKYIGIIAVGLTHGTPNTDSIASHPERFIFPIAAIEGKPVFVGDKPWFIGNDRVPPRQIKVSRANDMYIWSEEGCAFLSSDLSWIKPKPKTVMVEMLVEDANNLTLPGGTVAPPWHIRLSNACRKALEEQNGNL